MLQPQSKRPGERARAFLTRADVRDALRCLLLALILSFVTEAICRLNPIAAAGYVFTRPLAFLYNTLLIACTLSLALLVKRRRFAYTLISAIWVVLSIVDCCIRLVRITPLNFYDFVIFVSNFSITQSYVTWWQIALIVLAVAALITGMVILFRRAPKLHPARRPALLLLAALCGLTAVITPIYALNNRDYTDPVAGYNRSGFAYSFCRSVVDRGIRRPETYDENVIDGILADVGGDAQPAAATEKLPNFVFLQLESFLDPANITSVTCSENPVPVFTRLKEECSTGLLHVPMIGGGTANVEFEVITGMNLGDFGTGEYPYSTILKSETCETIAYDLRNMGYTAHAIHNHIATFYERNQVYAMLGFDTFTSLEYMTNYTTNSLGWCRDKVLTGCILDALRSGEERDLVFAVSVQGHGKYSSNPPQTPYPITSTGLEDNPSLKNEFEYYINQLHETDEFLGELLDALREYPEPVVLVIYGDHLPALAFDADDLRAGTMLATEYVIWPNDDSLPKVDQDLHSYQLTACTLERYGISGGVLASYHQRCRDDADYLSGLSVLEYDTLYGDKLLYEGQAPYPRVDMRMGVKDITVERASFDGKRLVVKGENFTRYSVIYANGHALSTTYVDSETLVATPTLLTSIHVGDQIEISQLSVDATVLSTSNAIICEEEQ